MRKKKDPITEYFDISFFENEQIAPFNSDINSKNDTKPYYIVSSEGRIFSTAKKRFRELSPSKNKRGYLKFSATNVDGTITSIPIHRAVLATFNPVENMCNMQVNHEDGNKINNTVENLSWCTPQENMDHAFKNQLKPNLSDDELKEIVRMIKEGYSDFEISEHSPATESTVKCIRIRKMYRKRLDAIGYTEAIKHVIDNLPDDVYIRVIELAKLGYSDGEIGSMLNIAKVTASNIRKCVSQYKEKFKRLNLSPVLRRAPNHPDEVFVQIINLYKKGLTMQQIADKLNEKHSFVKSVIYRKGDYDEKLRKLGL